MHGATPLPRPRRGLPSRLASLLLAAVFLLLGVGEGLGRPHCPHHDAVSAAHVPAAPADAHGHGDAPADPAHPGGCTCPGPCLDGPPVHPPAEAPTFAAAWAPPRVRDEAPRSREILPGRTPYTLPYAQAPPTLG